MSLGFFDIQTISSKYNDILSNPSRLPFSEVTSCSQLHVLLSQRIRSHIHKDYAHENQNLDINLSKRMTAILRYVAIFFD